MTGDLPKGWMQVQLGDVCLPVSKVDPRQHPDQEFEYIDIGGVPPGAGQISETKLLKGDDAPSRARQLVRAGDVVLSTVRTYQRKTAIVPQRLDGAVASTGFSVLRPHHEIVPDFILFQALSHEFVMRLSAQQTGTSYPAVRDRDVRAMSIRLPPFDEQRRIVTTIEEHFSRLEALTTAVKAAQRRLDALLISVLRETCTGMWPECALSELIVSLKNGVFVSRPSVDPPGKPIYRISAVRPLNLRVNDIRYAHPVPDKADSYAVDAGDLLFTRYSGNPQYVGAAAVVPPEGAGVLHPDKLIRVVADEEKALPEWIAAYVAAGKGRSEIERRLKTTAGQVGISGSQLKTVPIAVPPLSYQERAASRIGLMLSEHERIRQQIADLDMKGQALRRSILADAFSGQLVPQDPNDEPASALLELIEGSPLVDTPNAALQVRES